MASSSTDSFKEACDSLAQFERKHQHKMSKRRCFVCRYVPVEARQVMDARFGQVSLYMMAAWITERYNISVTREKLRSHFMAGHHKEDGEYEKNKGK